MGWVIGALIGASVGALVAWLAASRRLAALEASAAVRAEETEKRVASMASAEARMKESFDALAAGALQRSIEEFLKLATDKFDGLKKASTQELESKRAAVEELLKPLKQAIDVYQRQAGEMADKRIEEAARLQTQLSTLMQAQGQLQAEAHKLAESMRSGRVRGRWGEVTLQRIVELAGMVEHCDFVTQTSGEEGGRPDMTVRMPAGRRIAVDAKVPFDAYLESLEAPTEEARAAAALRHAAALKSHVDALASKEYWRVVGSDLDLVVMFVPNDSFVAAAVSANPALVEYAVNKRVILATPWTLVALLKAVELGWREEKLAENAARISEAGRLVHERSAVLMEHIVKIGKGLDGVVKVYNEAAKSLQSRFLPAVERMEELGARGSKPLPEIAEVSELPEVPSEKKTA